MRRSSERILIAALVLLTGVYAVAEEVTLMTYYPSPRGVYDQLRSMGETLLAQNLGSNVGIGTATPGTKLHVVGGMRLQNGTPAVGRVLTATDALGTMDWQPSPVPVGAIMMFNGVCPAGWSEVVAARGRYIVGACAACAVGASIGAPALGIGEQRNNAGIHSHAITDPGHFHFMDTAWLYNRWLGGATNAITDGWGGGVAVTPTQANTTGITVDSTGTAATNAPYLTMRLCSKN